MQRGYESCSCTHARARLGARSHRNTCTYTVADMHHDTHMLQAPSYTCTHCEHRYIPPQASVPAKLTACARRGARVYTDIRAHAPTQTFHGNAGTSVAANCEQVSNSGANGLFSCHFANARIPAALLPLPCPSPTVIQGTLRSPTPGPIIPQRVSRVRSNSL